MPYISISDGVVKVGVALDIDMKNEIIKLIKEGWSKSISTFVEEALLYTIYKYIEEKDNVNKIDYLIQLVEQRLKTREMNDNQ